MPYGKRFAIFCSAFTFGLFHGNLIQTPFAFAVGLVLGYVAAEYSIGWAMVLHMINNLLIADSLTRLTAGLPEEMAGLLIWGILLLFGIAGTVVLIKNRRKIRQWLSQEQLNQTCLKCFFSSGGVIAFVVLMLIMMVVSLTVMITPI
jgi:membrane protease YdiL (CAAX protease family)